MTSMWNLLDISELFISYSIILTTITALNLYCYINQKKGQDLPNLRKILLILLISSFSFHIIDSIPYLFITIYAFPLINIIRSTLILFLIAFDFMLFGYYFQYRVNAYLEAQEKNAD